MKLTDSISAFALPNGFFGWKGRTTAGQLRKRNELDESDDEGQ